MKRKAMKKKNVCSLWILAAMVLYLLGNNLVLLQVKAQEPVIEEKNQVMAAGEDIEVMAEPTEQSETVHVYEEGDSVLVIGEEQDGWYQIKYQDGTGYVPADSLTDLDIDVEGIDEEFKIEEEEGKLVVEVVERKRAEIRRARIWGTIIVILVIGIFSLGIFSAIKANKEQNGEKEAKPDRTKEAEIEETEKSENDVTEKETEADKTENENSEIPVEIMDLDQE